MDDTGQTQRLLLLSCSQRKRLDPGLLPAIDRYDGPLFRVLRRYRRDRARLEQRDRPQPDVYILSAEYGLISSEQPIAYYEQRMTAQRAEALRPLVLADFFTILDLHTGYQELFFCMGRDYLRALAGWEIRRSQNMSVIYANGSIGGRQAQLYDWLYGTSPSLPGVTGTGRAVIRGVEVTMTPEEVFAATSLALSNDGKQAANFQKWYIQVGNRRVSPKWLVSRLTGLPVSAFATDDARRFLAQLGLVVMRS